MGEPSPKKRKPSAKSLANLRPHPQHLRRGGRTSTKVPNEQEILFCAAYARTRNLTHSARAAGFTRSLAQKGRDLLKRDDIQKQVQKEATKIEERASRSMDKLLTERQHFIHEQLLYRLGHAETHEYRGDADIAKMIEIGFRSTGDIRPNSVSASATSAANAKATSVVPIDIYKPAWLREKEAQLLIEAENRYGPVLPSAASRALLPETALIYMERAGGDKDRARQMAKTDGWEF